MNLNVKKPLVVLGYPKIDHEKDYVYHWMPFSLLTVAKSLIDAGTVDVAIFDGNQRTEADWTSLIQGNSDRILFVGLSIMTGGGQIRHALKLAATVRETSERIPLVFGGPHVSVLPEQTAEHPLVDIALSGPGQNAIVALAEAFKAERSYEEVPGLRMKTKGKAFIVGPPNPPRTGSLGQYPWSLLDVPSYIRDDPTVGSRTLNYVSSQGCAYQCRFCFEQTYNRKWSAQEPEPLLRDIENLVSTYDLNGIKFYDADWFINLKRASAICRGLENYDGTVKWAASINPNDILRARKVSPNLLADVAKSGCSRLLMGVESGSNRVLNEIVKKETTRERIISVAEEIAGHGILGSYTFIIGFPGETDEEIEETYGLLDFLRRLTPQPETRVHLFAPYPGTPLFDAAIKLGFMPPAKLEEWSSFDYYESQTPWTSSDVARRARQNTHMLNSSNSCEEKSPILEDDGGH